MNTRNFQKFFYSLIFSSSFFCSCKQDASSRPDSIGKHGEIVVVIENELWKSSSGKELRKIFNAEHPGLPQSEPLFDLVNIPLKSFSNSILSTHANVILVYISDSITKPSVTVKRDLWAEPQFVMKMRAKDETAFAGLLDQYAEKTVTIFNEEERKRIGMDYKKQLNRKATESVKNKFGCTLIVPNGFAAAVQKENFLWIRHEESEISKGIIIYTTEYSDSLQFSKEKILATRDSVLKRYIPGPADSSYMTTEHRYPSHFKEINFHNNYGTEIRGLWKVEGDFMGGPFINLSVYDKRKNRIITVEGYVFSPKYDKREHLRSVEAIVYSLQL